MSLKKTFALGAMIPAFIISADMIFQISNVAAYNNFCRSVVLATHLTDIQFLDVSSETLQKGYFTASFTFENPTDQTVNMTSLSAVLFPTSPSIFPLALGQGSIQQPITLGSGETLVVLQMSLTKNASPTLPSYWEINYSLKFGTVHYSFNSTTQTFPGLPALRTFGPYIVGEDPALIQVATYSYLAIDAWAIGLEAIAVFTLSQERKINKTMRGETQNDHSKMAGTIYALQGITILVYPQFALFMRNSVTQTPPPEFVYGGHGAAGVLSDILTGAYYLLALILLATSLGLFRRLSLAKSIALFLSSIGALGGLILGIATVIMPAFWSSNTALRLTIGTLILATAFSNILVVYTISRRAHTASYKGQLARTQANGAP